MREFIVWSMDNKKFINRRIAVAVNGYGKLISPDEFEIFDYIGKTDIEDKKIYADCSIVEFKYIVSRTVMKHETGYIAKQPFIELENMVFKAYFQYHTDELRYELIILDYDKSKTNSIFSVLSFNMETMSNFKIIGTLQEDKHLFS